MASPFNPLLVFVKPDGCRVIGWTFAQGVDIPATATISVLRARAGGPWQTLQQGLPLSYCYADSTAWNRNKYNNDFYKVVLTTGDGQRYQSDPQKTGMTLSYPYYSQANNLIRLSQKQIEETGRQGLLLKKIQYGPKCPVCQQFQDDNPVNQHCPSCLGTGKLGGYYQAIKLNILESGQSQTHSIQHTGDSRSVVLQAKCTAWPIIQYGDLWVDSFTNQRFYIDSVSVASKFKHVPLIYNLRMHLIQQSDVLYKPQASRLLQNATVQAPPTQWTQGNIDWDRDVYL